jgi:hypothetical protein
MQCLKSRELPLTPASADDVIRLKIESLSAELETCDDGFKRVVISCELNRLRGCWFDLGDCLERGNSGDDAAQPRSREVFAFVLRA